jgi:hypothetical protein
MKSWIWLRTLSIILFLFAAGHTLGTAAPRVTRGAREAAVFDAMQGFRFPVMGFDRSYWDFYRGFALTISVLQLALALFAWQIAGVGKQSARLAWPMTITLWFACAGLFVLSCLFFFGGPIVFAAVAVALSTVGAALTIRERDAE